MCRSPLISHPPINASAMEPADEPYRLPLPKGKSINQLPLNTTGLQALTAAQVTGQAVSVAFASSLPVLLRVTPKPFGVFWIRAECQ